MRKTVRAAVCAILSIGLLAGCGKPDGTQAAITVDDEELSLGAASFYLRAEQAETQTMMEAYGFLDGTYFWDQSTTDDDGKSTTYGKQLKDSAREELAGYVLLRRHAADYDLELPESVTDAAAEAAKSIYEANTEMFEEIGSTEDDIREVLELSAYPTLMTDAMTADVDLEVSDEEAAQTRVVYARIRQKETDEEGDSVDASDETKEAYLASMEQLLADIQEAGEVDEDAIREMANEIDEDNIMVGATSYGADDAYLPEEVLEAAATLQDGETYGEVIETSEGYYYLVHMVAVLDREATDREKTTIANQRKSDAYNALLEEWIDGAEVTTSDAWDKLTVVDAEVWKATIPASEE